MDKVEFEQMVNIHGPDILRFCRLKALSVEEGDELYQETLLTMWEKRDRLDSDSNIKSYALSVAFHILRNKKRKYAIRNRIAPSASYNEMNEKGDSISCDDADIHDPLNIAIADEETRIVRKCVRELPDKYSDIIYLYYTTDLNINEIAVMLKLPTNTVKTRLSRARKILKSRLEEIL